MRLSDLQSKDIVDINSGIKIGKIIDAIIEDSGNLKCLIVLKNKFINFLNNNEVEILWNQIVKIGDDVILVKI